jgi:hypothetical protein
MYLVSLSRNFAVLIIYILAGGMLLYDSQCHDFSLFFLYEQMKQTLAENERKADEIHANEMRHMIGNVAHDLKTVSFPYNFS